MLSDLEVLEGDDRVILRKEHETDKITWLDHIDQCGVWEFTFDGKTVFNLFSDYPHKLTPEQKKIFDSENPYWADFFKDRT